MFDYYDKVMSMDAEELSDELLSLREKLSKTGEGTAVSAQLIEMYEMAEAAFSELRFKQRVSTEPTVTNIGEMESLTTEPDYSSDELLIAIVEGYTK